MKGKLNELKEELEAACVDSDRLINLKKKSAAVVLRRRMKRIRNLAKEIGVEALEIKKAL